MIRKVILIGRKILVHVNVINDKKRHHLIVSSHPSPLSCYKKYKWVYEGVSEDYSQYSIGISL